MQPVTVEADTHSLCTRKLLDLIEARKAAGEVFCSLTTPRKVGSQFEATATFVKDPDHV